MSLVKEINSNNTSKVLELLQLEADLNQKDPRSGNTLLHLAIDKRNEAVIKALLNPQNSNVPANPNLVNDDGFSPLAYAVMNFKEAIPLLLKAGADVNLRLMENKTALHYAAEIEDPDMIKLLVKQGADINSLSKSGTPLHIALQENASENASILLEQPSINLLEINESGDTPLHTAVKAGANNIFVKIAEVLEKKVAADEKAAELVKEILNKKNKQGNTVLHEAAVNGRSVLANFLGERGVKLGLDPELKNKDGLTAAQIKEKLVREEKEKNEQAKLKKREIQVAKKEKQKAEEEERERNRIQREEEEEEERKAQAKAAVDVQQMNKRGPYLMIGLVAFLLIGMYVALDMLAKRKKENYIEDM